MLLHPLPKKTGIYQFHPIVKAKTTNPSSRF